MTEPPVSQDPVQPTPKKEPWYQRPAVPGVLAIILFIVIFLVLFGHIPKFSPANPDAIEIHPSAVIGKAASYNFTSLIDQLPAGSNAPYTFSLRSGGGYPPPGLVLGTDGRLKGTPSGQAQNFDICVAASGGSSVCRTFHLTVNPAQEPVLTTTRGIPGTCPVTSCDTGTCCGSVHNSVRVSGVLTSGGCRCPGDTEFAQQDVITPGGPYNICTCLNSSK